MIVDEHPLSGSSKVAYRAGAKWDFEAGTDHAPIDVSLVMPPHRPKNQPQYHRNGMLIASETGSIKAKVCRHCLNRSFNLRVVSHSGDITVWVPSNFSGYISYNSPRKAVFSTGFANNVLPNVYVNARVPKTWQGDEMTVSTSGTITFRMWDVFAKAPEVPRKEMWKSMFNKSSRSPTTQTSFNWDFLLDDDDD